MTVAPKPGGFQVFSDLEAATYAALKESIATRGVLVPVIVDQHHRIIDGHNRIRAAAELGVDCPQVLVPVKNHQDGRDVALLLNTVRRHLDVEQRRTVVADLRAAGHSLRAIAGAVGVSKSQVAKDVEAEQVDTGGHLAPDRTTGQDGKSYPARKPVPAPPPPVAPVPAEAKPDEDERCDTCGEAKPDVTGGWCVDCWESTGEPEATPLPAPPVEDDAAMARLKLRAATAGGLKRALGFFAEFPPELVASQIDGDEWDDWQRRRRSIDDWFDRLDALRPAPGLRLMGGGR